jgi:hypothetical protein
MGRKRRFTARASAFAPSAINPHKHPKRRNQQQVELRSDPIFFILLLVGFAQLLGYFFVKLRQPKVVGEILAGVVLGPALIGRLPIASGLMEATKHQGSILNFVYWLGLLLLAYAIAVLLGYCVVAGALDVSLVSAAFLAGF